MSDSYIKTAIRGQEFRCPHCQAITTATAILDCFGHHEGSIPLTVNNGKIYLDWNNADLDLEIFYHCDACGGIVTDCVNELEDAIRAYESDNND